MSKKQNIKCPQDTHMHSVTLTAEIFETNNANTTLFITVQGITHSAQVMHKGKGHAERAARYCREVSRSYSALTPHAAATSAILSIESAGCATRPASYPTFGFAVTLIETALTAAV